MDDQSYHLGSQAVIPYGYGFLHVLEGVKSAAYGTLLEDPITQNGTTTWQIP
jgi:hypothetical protein